LVRGSKKAVDISSNKGTPCIAYGNSICVYHWDNFENALLSQSISNFIFTQQEFDDAMYHP
jgi:hypothetical protein